LDRSAQHGRQATADGETEARPLVLALKAGIELPERLKELREILSADPDPGVGHGEAQKRAFAEASGPVALG
jgi:hypothetical protein